MRENRRGEGDRLNKPAAEELLNTAYTFELKNAESLYQGMSYADIAHVCMLLEEEIIPKKSGKNLLTQLLELNKTSIQKLDVNPSFGDLYTNREQIIKQKIGDDAGWLHTGRARRECSTIGFLIACREKCFAFAAALLAVARSLLELSNKHLDTIMTDFTYLQHAQPTSLGHYVLTFLYPLLRDIERLQEAFIRLNLSPAGSGSVNGSRIPLNRERVAKLLGFEEITIHTRDAMWRPDIPIELYSILVSSSININRFGEELQIWSTSEFNMVELADEYCRTSVIMPQKKNPYGLSYFRGLTGLLIGRYCSISSIMKTTSGQPDNRIFAYGELPESIELCTKGLKLFAAIISSLRVNTEICRNQSLEGFSASTDLAEIIMMTQDIDYATTHKLVGSAVRLAIERGENTVSTTELEEAAVREKINIDLSKIDFNEINDPIKIVESRKGLGGAAKDRVLEMIEKEEEKIMRLEKWLEEKSCIQKNAFEMLMRNANKLASD